MRIVIIGNGISGMEAALRVRDREPGCEITIISEESDHFFSRTALMWVHSGQMSYENIEPLERDVYARLDFKRVRARATRVDVEAHTVQLAGDAAPVPYDKLLIACGSRPRPGPWDGSDLRGVGHFVTMQDLQWLEEEVHGGPSHGGVPPRPEAHLRATTEDSPYLLRESAAKARGTTAKSLAVIGGGLIGIEAVEVAHAAGIHPHFFIREEWFWPMAINEDESRWITERMREHGVHVHLEHNVERIEGQDGNVSRVVSDKGAYDVDSVVIAIGVIPNTSWLEGSDIDLDKRGGILVDASLKTSAPDVYAAGDCAAVRWFDGAVRPQQLWYTGRDQGRVAARALLGDEVSYARGTWYNSAKLMDIEYTTAGLVNMKVEGEQNWYFEEDGSVRSTTRVVMAGERVIGFNLLGRRWDHSVLNRFIHERRPLAYVLEHLHEASFDTEFVPPLRIPDAARRQELRGPAANPYIQGPTVAPTY